MGHGHSHGPRQGASRSLGIALVLSAGYLVAEVVGGIVSGSLALLADAGHMLSDVASLALALWAIRMAQRPPDRHRTFGYHRSEILAALANGATLVAVSLYILVEAYHRLQDPQPVQGPLMLAIAVGGLLVNLAGLWVMREGREGNLNVRGAWLHVLTDALGSVQAIVAGGLIWAFGWTWADPVASVLISLLVVHSAWALLKESVGILMEGSPAHLDVEELRSALLAVPGVVSVHDLHAWTIGSGFPALTAHVVARRDGAELLRELRALLHDRFHLEHTTIQIEPEGFGHHCGAGGECL